MRLRQRILGVAAALLTFSIVSAGGCNVVLGIHDLDEGSAGPDAGSFCGVDAQCDDSNPCTVDTCKGGGCEHLAQPDGPAASSAQVPFDCQVITCVKGLPEPQNDDADGEDDAEACTVDTCSDGEPLHTAKPDMTACTMGGDGLCKGGKCEVPCTIDAACDDKNSCTQDSCDIATGLCSFVPVPGMSTTPEVCADGIDNDCDGKTDCADGDCAAPVGGSACVAPAPSGWTVVSFAPDAGASCPKGFGSPAIVASPPDSPGTTCACNCGAPQANPCTKGALTLQLGYLGCGGPMYNTPVTGACDVLSPVVNTNYTSGRANTLPPVQVACGATGALPGVKPSGGVTCLPSGPPGGGCTGGEVCLPRSASSSLCIQRTGDVVCPAGPYTKRAVVAAAADVVDARTCAACSCTSTATACTGAKLTGYDDAACTQQAVTVDVDGTCKLTPDGTDFQNSSHFIYSATPNTLACVPSGGPPAVIGGFKLDNPTTLCCQ